MSRTTLEIIPDRKLLPTLGLGGYTFAQAVSELVDNSIDSFQRLENPINAEIKISFKADGNELTIEDNAEGMSLEQLKSALRIAHAPKEKTRLLGQYGMGMKAACATLGKTFFIETSAQNSGKEVSVKYSEEKWLKGQDDDWKIDADEETTLSTIGFTRIKITDLKVKLYAYRKEQLLEHLSTRYGEYIRNGIKITVNGEEVKPIEYKLVKPTDNVKTKYFEIPITEMLSLGNKGEIILENGQKIKGWVGLLQKSSQRGFYGLHLFRENRLINEYNKELLRSRTTENKKKDKPSAGHPGLARVIGEIHLNHVEVAYTKREFNYESKEWEKAEQAIISDLNFKAILTKSRDMAQAKGKKLTPAKEKKLQNITNQIFSYIQGIEAKKGENVDWVLPLNSEKYNIETKYVANGENGEMYSLERSENKITITTNTDFPAYKITKDIVFYLTLNLIDALAETQTENDSLTKFKEIRTKLLKQIGELMKKVEDSK